MFWKSSYEHIPWLFIWHFGRFITCSWCNSWMWGPYLDDLKKQQKLGHVTQIIVIEHVLQPTRKVSQWHYLQTCQSTKISTDDRLESFQPSIHIRLYKVPGKWAAWESSQNEWSKMIMSLSHLLDWIKRNLLNNRAMISETYSSRRRISSTVLHATFLVISKPCPSIQ